MLARWDGKRRYANLRKLMRLARSYEELRGPDIEGFVRFIRDQEAVGAAQLEAVSEEEGADAVRLLTIHAAKGLEFKVVIVADAGRDTGRPPSPDEILALVRRAVRLPGRPPDVGQARARVQVGGGARGRAREEDAERLRLYYVAMTRAVDRLIVSGAIDPERPHDRETPIGWVLGRLAAQAEVEAAVEPVELARGDARFLAPRRPRRDEPRGRGGGRRAVRGRCAGQLELFAELPGRTPGRAATGCPSSICPSRRRCIGCGGSRTRRSRCTTAARTATTSSALPGCARSGPWAPGRRGSRRRRSATRCTACSSSSTCASRLRPPWRWCSSGIRPRPPTRSRASAAFVDAYCELGARGASRRSRTCGPSAPSRSSTTASCCTAASTSCSARAAALVLDYKTNSLAEHEPDEIIEADYRLQRLVYALACFRAGADEVEVVYAFLERADAVVSTTFVREEIAARGRAVGGDRPDRLGRVHPDAERVHVLRLSGARPRLCRAAAAAAPAAVPAGAAAV